MTKDDLLQSIEMSRRTTYPAWTCRDDEEIMLEHADKDPADLCYLYG